MFQTRDTGCFGERFWDGFGVDALPRLFPPAVSTAKQGFQSPDLCHCNVDGLSIPAGVLGSYGFDALRRPDVSRTRRHRQGHVSGVSRAVPPLRPAQARQAGLQAAATPVRVRAELLLWLVDSAKSESEQRDVRVQVEDVDIFFHPVVGLIYANLFGGQNVTLNENLGRSVTQATGLHFVKSTRGPASPRSTTSWLDSPA